MPQASSRNRAVLVSRTPDPHSPEHAELEIDLGSKRLSCEARSYSASWGKLAIGAPFPFNLHFESFWGEPWIGVRRATAEQQGVWRRDEVYRIRGTVVAVDEEENEMLVDCGTDFIFAMDKQEGLGVTDRIEADGWFLVFLPEDLEPGSRPDERDHAV